MMESGVQKWQRSMIRDGIDRYRESLENYYVRNKRIVELPGGAKAFSLLSPPLGSPAARRRIRFIMRNVTANNTVVGENGAVTWGGRTPHFLTAAVTYRCQCDCAHCSASDYKDAVERDQTALSVEELKDAIRQAIALGTTCVVLTGGEPLLLDGLCELIESVDPAESVCTIFTNGELLSEDSARRLKQAGLFGVFVSLDASQPAQHNANRRRPGLFAKATAGVRHCQKAGLLTGLSTYATGEKIRSGELDAMMELARRLEVLEVFLFDVIATGRLGGERECMLSDSEVEEIAAFRTRYNEAPDYPRVIHQTMFTSIAYPCAAEGCPAGVAQIHLRGNGDVAPCDFAPFSFGNVRLKPLAQIWEQLSHHEIYAQGSRRCRLADPAYWDSLAAYASSI